MEAPMGFFDRGPRREGTIEKPRANGCIFGAVLLAYTADTTTMQQEGPEEKGS